MTDFLDEVVIPRKPDGEGPAKPQAGDYFFGKSNICLFKLGKGAQCTRIPA
jgi:hypothetical protein